MRKLYFIIVFVFIFFNDVLPVESNAVVQRRQQQQQQQQQQQMQQQVANARQQAYEQAMQAQQQLQQMAQQNAQQTQQALQAVRNGYAPSSGGNYQAPTSQRSVSTTTTLPAKSPFNSSDLPEPFHKDPPIRKETVKTIGEVWQEMEKSSYIWLQIMDMHGKELTVSRQKELFRAQGAIINKPAFLYVELIDRMARENQDMLKAPFKDVLRVLAIMEYDFDIGRDKDELARQVLGEDIYWSNRQRLGLN